MGLLGLCCELHCARIGNGSQTKTKMEIILQENGGIHRRQHKVDFSILVLVVSAQDASIHFFLLYFEGNFVYISAFKNGPMLCNVR